MGRDDADRGGRPETAREWQQLFRDWDESGLTQEAFCRKRGLSLHVFRARRYGRQGAGDRNAKRRPGRRTGFVPVRVVGRSEGAALSLLRPSAPVLEVVLTGGRVVRISSGFDAEMLARVIAVVEGRTC